MLYLAVHQVVNGNPQGARVLDVPLFTYQSKSTDAKESKNVKHAEKRKEMNDLLKLFKNIIMIYLKVAFVVSNLNLNNR